MDRRDELLKILDNVDESKKIIVLPMIDDIIFMEKKLEALRKLPFIRIHPDNEEKQKVTPAAKQYKELLQQYNNCIKILVGTVSKDEGSEDSPLKEYFKHFMNQ